MALKQADMALDEVNSQNPSISPSIRWLDFGLNFLFPGRCLVCGDRMGYQNLAPVCENCWEEVRFIQNPVCYKCGHPLYAQMGSTPPEEIYCQSCRKNPPVYVQARSIFYYTGIIRKLIHCFKYQGKVRVGKFFARSILDGSILGCSILNDWKKDFALPTIACVVPVPIGIKKLRHREFNQSFILAREIGKYLKVPVYPFALKREKEVAPQMKLSRKERMENIQGSFSIRDSLGVHKKEVLLVDDVFTTGATVAECSKVLLQHGAKQVRVLTLSRTVIGQ